MKLKCINNQEKLWFSKTETISGLTVGKVYIGNVCFVGESLVPVVIVYDDNNKWSDFSNALFEPVE